MPAATPKRQKVRAGSWLLVFPDTCQVAATISNDKLPQPQQYEEPSTPALRNSYAMPRQTVTMEMKP